jgi:alanine racemase
MSVKARITQVKTIPPGTGISYGHLFVSQKEMRVAVVSIGYADGVLRNLSNRMQAIVRGRLVQQVGAITMDQLTIDVSDVPNVQAGDIVTLLGTEGKCTISAEDWAQTLDTISWEILCGFKHRLPRITV